MVRLIEYGTCSDKIPLFAFPGIDGSIGSIEPIVRELSGNRQVVVLDYTGENNPTLEKLTAEMAEAIKRRGSGHIDVLGQSIGTVLAAQIAGIRGLPVRRIVLMCTFTRLRWGWLRVVNFLLRITPGWLYRLTTRPMMTIACGPVGDGRNHPFFEASRNSNKEGVIRRTSWEINRNFGNDLATINSPCLILMGAKDRFIPNIRKELEALDDVLKGRRAKMIAVPNAGHVFLSSSAITFAVTQIEGFLAE